tara:strand:+ start:439 stop:573 length:135 start_codon:yes stop_codon:yes gene_type:complete
MITDFTHWAIEDLWEQYQFCQLNANKYHNKVLKNVIAEIKKRNK